MARKWFMLTAYCALIFSNGFAFSNLAPITKDAEDYFNQSEERITFLVEIFYVFYFPFAPFASWLLTKSLHKCMILSWLLTLVGMWVKFAGGSNYWVVLLGQAILSTATPLILTAVSSLSVIWFPPTQRLFATSIGELFTFVGIGVSFIMATTMSISMNYLMQSIVVTAFTVLYILLGKNDPNTPPNLTLGHFFQETKVLILDGGHLALILIVGCLTGLAYSFVGVLGEALVSEGINEFQASVVGFLISITGLAGGLAVTFIEHFEVSPLKVVPIFSLGGCVAVALWGAFAGIIWVDYVMGGVLGFFFFGLIPLGLRLSISYDKEVIETIPSGLIFMLAQIFALAFTYALLDTGSIGLHPLWVLGILFFIGCAILIIVMYWHSDKLIVDESGQVLNARLSSKQDIHEECA